MGVYLTQLMKKLFDANKLLLLQGVLTSTTSLLQSQLPELCYWSSFRISVKPQPFTELQSTEQKQSTYKD